MPRWSVRTIISYQKKHGHNTLFRRPGRPRIADLRDHRRIVREAKKNRYVSAAVRAAQVSKEIGRPVSSDVVRDRIHEAGLHGRLARK
ncbi:hypothetical protein PC128_g12884 [Phytophthora cactorum]|nr:hypothetical protein PC128_g12884 [Phytophthora cactorum]